MPVYMPELSIRAQVGPPLAPFAGMAPEALLAELPQLGADAPTLAGDGLTLFVSREYWTHVLVRARPDERFAAPNYVISASHLVGWHALPLGDCRRIVTTWSPGGCHSEDLHFIDAD